MQNVALQIEELSLDYGARRVLSGISLQLSAGETLVVAGANGSGKSTLLRVLCGLQQPSGGRVQYRIGVHTHAPVNARALLGWLSPDLQLYRELTALENLRFFGQVRGLALDDAALEGRLADVGLAGRGNDLLAAYSSGMAQRLRFAYATLHDPPVLLLDEPTLTLDSHGVGVFEQVVARQRRHGLLVIATNDPREERFGDLVLRLAADTPARS